MKARPLVAVLLALAPAAGAFARPAPPPAEQSGSFEEDRRSILAMAGNFISLQHILVMGTAEQPAALARQYS